MAGAVVSSDLELVQAALPNYELGHELGRGSCGVVLTATHKRLGRTVAIKELPRAFAADAEVRARFAAEAQLLASFDHPHIVPIYDYVEDHGVCLLVMEYMPGGNVWTRFSDEGFRFETSVAIALATALALEYSHRRDVLHRDVKPDNLLFSRTGAIKVSDFGLAKVMSGGATMVTRTGQILGTPAYIAPEQALAQPITPATDVYSLGVMLFELLSGDLPFLDDGNPVRLLLRHVNDEARVLSAFAPDVPSPLDEIVMRAISKDPADRYPSAWDLAAALTEAAGHLWGPDWLERSGVPIDLPDRLVSRATLQAFPAVSPGPVRSAVSLDEPRRSKRLSSLATAGTAGPSTPNAPEPIADLSVDDVVPIEEFLVTSGDEVEIRPTIPPGAGGDQLADGSAGSPTATPPTAAPPAPAPSAGAEADPEPERSRRPESELASQPEVATIGTPAGWHPDPWAVATWRWWDGEAWTSYTG